MQIESGELCLARHKLNEWFTKRIVFPPSVVKAKIEVLNLSLLGVAKGPH